jgi:hypothetical protein
MYSLLTLSLLGATVAAAPAPQLIDLTPGYSKGDSNAARFRYYENPDPLQGPCDLATGPDGNIWSVSLSYIPSSMRTDMLSLCRAQNILDNTISKIEIESGRITNYKYPDGLYLNQSSLVTERIAFSCAIRPGSDGNLYAATGLTSQFLKINPSNGDIKLFTPPLPNVPFLGNLQPFNDLYDGGSGVSFVAHSSRPTHD